MPASMGPKTGWHWRYPWPTFTERQRAILKLRFVDGLTQSEIADRVGVSQMHVSRLLADSLTALEKGLRMRARLINRGVS